MTEPGDDTDSGSLTYILIAVGLVVGLIIIITSIIVIVYCRKKRGGNVDQGEKAPDSSTGNDNKGYERPTSGEDYYTEIDESRNPQYRTNSILPDGQEEGEDGGWRRHEEGYQEIREKYTNPGSTDDDPEVQYRINSLLPQ